MWSVLTRPRKKNGEEVVRTDSPLGVQFKMLQEGINWWLKLVCKHLSQKDEIIRMWQ